jgi:hypothetical protein
MTLMLKKTPANTPAVRRIVVRPLSRPMILKSSVGYFPTVKQPKEMDVDIGTIRELTWGIYRGGSGPVLISGCVGTDVKHTVDRAVAAARAFLVQEKMSTKAIDENSLMVHFDSADYKLPMGGKFEKTLTFFD